MKKKYAYDKFDNYSNQYFKKIINNDKFILEYSLLETENIFVKFRIDWKSSIHNSGFGGYIGFCKKMYGLDNSKEVLWIDIMNIKIIYTHRFINNDKDIEFFVNSLVNVVKIIKIRINKIENNLDLTAESSFIKKNLILKELINK